jgi:hypothetical protein
VGCSKPQIPATAIRARIDFNLGLVQRALGRSDLAQAHFKQAREVTISQEAPAIIAKIDAATTSFSESPLS